jgi:hypothetical protein
MTIKEAKEVLRNAGYFVDNLWHIDDVDFDVSNEDKMQILDDVFSNGSYYERVFEMIGDIKEDYKFKKQ